MPAISNLILNDGLATPVAHTFNPARSIADFAQWEDRVAGIYIGFNKVSFQLIRPTGNGRTGSRNLKLNVKVETPKMETLSNSTVSGIAPAPTVAYRVVCEMNFTLPERSSLQDRKDMRAFIVSLVGTNQFTQALETFEMPW